MKKFKEFLFEAELKTKIEKLDDGRFLVMKWSERGKFYPDGKPFKTEKEAKEHEKTLKLKEVEYRTLSNLSSKLADEIILTLSLAK